MTAVEVDEDREFDLYLNRAQARELAVPPSYVNGKPVGWYPQDGSQNDFLRCNLFEVLYHGTRGPGKTDALLMSFAQHVGKGYGSAWRGIIFRQTYPQLADVQAKSEKWFRIIFPDAVFNRSKPMFWRFADGETLYFRHIRNKQDYWDYHGHEYPFIGWEELANWPNDECYKMMMSCCRSSDARVPRMVRATTNPYGPGHNWIKERWQLYGNWAETKIICAEEDKQKADDQGEAIPSRVAIHGNISENKILLDADPNYIKNIMASASNPDMVDAWLKGSWDIVSGGMFGDVWKPEYHVVEPFKIPPTWRIDRSFDWGSSKPFSVGWWAQSDGSSIHMPDGTTRHTVRGDLYRIMEWYGSNGKPNQGLQMLATEITKGIVQREANMPWGARVKAGVADSAIFTAENGNCIATDMARPVRLEGGRAYRGITWLPADKKPGSRKTGWEQMRNMLKNAIPVGHNPREFPGLFVFSNNLDFLRTVPNIPRCKKDPDDIDTNSEDHIADEVRYRVRFSYNSNIKQLKAVGHYY